MKNPIAHNPLQSRNDLQKSVLALYEPLKPYFSPGYARVCLGKTGVSFDPTAAELEGFARPLWGLVPLTAGGGQFEEWPRYRQGLVNGVNPAHAEYWGKPTACNQRLVEMAAIGLALALVPTQVWQPLEPDQKQMLAAWLGEINRVEVVDSNWLFFRVMVNLGLRKVDAPSYDPVAMRQALERLEEFYLGEGWYSDGPNPRMDYYIPFAFHFYGLIYATLAGESDPARAARFKERAALFAQDFIHWFNADGAALPFGRSLTYRFAQGSFWGALAFAGVEALPWGVIKGLALRQLRWWANQPIFNNDGTLSIGYAYPNLNMAEQYNSAGSPYWALKFFLPLALPATHPFWQAEELGLPDLAPVKAQPQAGLLLCGDKKRSHVFALSGQQHYLWAKHGEAKYAKFAYSTAFGFSVPGGNYGLQTVGYDSALALSEDDLHYRAREEILECRTEVEKNIIYSRWRAWPDVEIETWLFAWLPWHVRLHRLQTARPLYSAEGGFAVALPLRNHADPQVAQFSSGAALLTNPAGWSGIVDLTITNNPPRQGQTYFPHPNTNVLHPRTAIPALVAQHQPGEHWLACGVLGLAGSRDDYIDMWNKASGLKLEISDAGTPILVQVDSGSLVAKFS